MKTNFVIFLLILILNSPDYITSRTSRAVINKFSSMIDSSFVSPLLHDKNLRPKNTRTKIRMIRSFITSVLGHLEIPTFTAKKALRTKISSLMGSMRLFSDIASGAKTGRDLNQLEQWVKIKTLKEKLDNQDNIKKALKFIKKYIYVK